MVPKAVNDEYLCARSSRLFVLYIEEGDAQYVNILLSIAFK